jgi:hypothetical protein
LTFSQLFINLMCKFHINNPYILSEMTVFRNTCKADRRSSFATYVTLWRLRNIFSKNAAPTSTHHSCLCTHRLKMFLYNEVSNERNTDNAMDCKSWNPVNLCPFNSAFNFTRITFASQQVSIGLPHLLSSWSSSLPSQKCMCHL